MSQATLRLIKTHFKIEMKTIWALICLSYFVSIASPFAINCDYKTDSFIILRDQYKCEVKKGLEITSKNSTLITNVTDLHRIEGKSNDNVAVFKVFKQTVNYFPSGLKIFFKNLKGIAITFCGLKEVNQDDLKPFPNLTYLELSDNNIEVIEAGIFEYNQNLKLIWLKRNKIYHIDSKVFDGLTELTNLNLMGNSCIDSKGINVVEVKKVVESLNNTCKNQEYLTKKCNESMAAKLDKPIMLKNDSSPNIDQNSTSNHDFLLNSIKSLINENMEENFNKTQELFTNLAEKVDKLEQNLNETKIQLTEYYEENSKISNEMLHTLSNIQWYQKKIVSNYLTNYSTKCDNLPDKTTKNLTNTLISIQETQNYISQELQKLKIASQSSSLNQNLSLIMDDVEQVKVTLSNTQTYVADTIKINVNQTKSELETLKVNIQEVKDKTLDMGTKVEVIRSDLETIRKESQILTTISPVTEASMDKPIMISTTSEKSTQDNSTTKAGENVQELSTKAAGNKEDSSSQVENISTSTTKYEESSISCTQETDTKVDPIIEAADNSTSTIQDANYEEDQTAKDEDITEDPNIQAADNAHDSSILSTDNIDSSAQAADKVDNSTSTVKATDNEKDQAAQPEHIPEDPIKQSTDNIESSSNGIKKSTSPAQTVENKDDPTTQNADNSTLSLLPADKIDSSSQAMNNSTYTTQATENIENLILQAANNTTLSSQAADNTTLSSQAADNTTLSSQTADNTTLSSQAADNTTLSSQAADNTTLSSQAVDIPEVMTIQPAEIDIQTTDNIIISTTSEMKILVNSTSDQKEDNIQNPVIVEETIIKL